MADPKINSKSVSGGPQLRPSANLNDWNGVGFFGHELWAHRQVNIGSNCGQFPMQYQNYSQYQYPQGYNQPYYDPNYGQGYGNGQNYGYYQQTPQVEQPTYNMQPTTTENSIVTAPPSVPVNQPIDPSTAPEVEENTLPPSVHKPEAETPSPPKPEPTKAAKPPLPKEISTTIEKSPPTSSLPKPLISNEKSSISFTLKPKKTTTVISRVVGAFESPEKTTVDAPKPVPVVKPEFPFPSLPETTTTTTNDNTAQTQPPFQSQQKYFQEPIETKIEPVETIIEETGNNDPSQFFHSTPMVDVKNEEVSIVENVPMEVETSAISPQIHSLEIQQNPPETTTDTQHFTSADTSATQAPPTQQPLQQESLDTSAQQQDLSQAYAYSDQQQYQVQPQDLAPVQPGELSSMQQEINQMQQAQTMQVPATNATAYDQYSAAAAADAVTNRFAQYPLPYHSQAQEAVDKLTQQQLQAYAATGIPLGLQYPISTVTVEVGTDIKSFGLKPKLQSTGGRCSYTSYPTLPEGITIDSTTGELYGTPTEVIGTNQIHVYARNAWGTAMTTIMFTVIDKVEDEQNDDDENYDYNSTRKIYSTKAEATQEFTNLLKDKCIGIEEPWASVLKKIKKDSRFLALNAIAEKRRTWKKYIKDLSVAAPSQPVKRGAGNLVKTETIQPATSSTGNESFDEMLMEYADTLKKKFIFAPNPSEILEKDSRFHTVPADKRGKIIENFLSIHKKRYQIIKHVDTVRKKDEFKALLKELCLLTHDPVFHVKSSFDELMQHSKFTKDRRFVVFIDGSCDLTLADVQRCFQIFCKDLARDMTGSKKKLEQYLKDLNTKVSGKDTVSELMRQHKKAVELKDVPKSYMKLIFKQKIETEKVKKKEIASIVSELRSMPKGSSKKQQSISSSATDYSSQQQQQQQPAYVMNQQYVAQYQNYQQESNQNLQSSNNTAAQNDSDCNNFDLDESLFEDSPLEADVRNLQPDFESNTTEHGMDMNDSEDEQNHHQQTQQNQQHNNSRQYNIRPLYTVKNKVAFTLLQKKTKEKKSSLQGKKVQSIKSLLKKIPTNKKGRSRFGKKFEDQGDEMYKPKSRKKFNRGRKEERSRSDSFDKRRSSSRRSFRGGRSRSSNSRSRSPVRRRNKNRSLSSRSRSGGRRLSRSSRRYSRSYSRDKNRGRKGSRSRSKSKPRGRRRYSRSRSRDSDSCSSSRDRSDSRGKRKRTRSISKKRKRRKIIKKEKKKRKLYSHSRSPSSSEGSGSSSSDESSRSSSLGEDRWRPG